MTAGRLRGVVVAAFLATVWLSSTSWAEPTAEDRAAAEALFIEGRSLVEKGDFEPACDRFEKSQKMDPQVGTLLYLATCHEQIGKTATAWVEFKDALTQAQASNKAERIQQASEGVARVEATLSKAKVVADDAVPGLVVRINGREVTAFGAELPYNPGKLSVEAEAPGHKKHTEVVELPKGPTSITISIPKLAVDETKPIEKPKPTPTRDHTLAYIVGGAGVGVTLVGLALGGAAWGTASSAEDECEGRFCTQDGLDMFDTADSLAWASNVFVGVGLAGVGAGVVLFFVYPPLEKEPKKPDSVGAPVLDFGSDRAFLGWKWRLQ